MGVVSVVLRVVLSVGVVGVRVVETIVVGVADGDVDEVGVSRVVTCSVANVVLGVVAGVVVVEVAVVVVDLIVVEVVVVALVVVVVVVVVVGLVVVVVVVVEVVVVVVGIGSGAVVVLLDRVTYANGVGVGGRDTPGEDVYYNRQIFSIEND